jgi:hypothetical protein
MEPASVGPSLADFINSQADFFNLKDFNLLLLADTKEFFFNLLIKIGKFSIIHYSLILILGLVVYLMWHFNRFKEKIGNYLYKSAMALEADRLDEVWSVGISDNIEQIEVLNATIRDVEKNSAIRNENNVIVQKNTYKSDTERKEINKKELEISEFTEAINVLRRL